MNSTPIDPAEDEIMALFNKPSTMKMVPMSNEQKEQLDALPPEEQKEFLLKLIREANHE
jgi:hypothetical protein